VSGVSGLRKHGHTSDGDGGTITVPGGDAADVTYDNSGSGLTATDVQAAIDEIDGTVDGFGSAVDISDDGANVQGVNFEDQGSNPATPAAGHTIAFTKSDGLYVKDDAGAITGPLGTGGGAVATDAIWDAKGDLAAGTGANTAAKLTAGSNDTILMADSGQSTGLKWVAAGTPVDQNYDDVAAVGTADTFARGDHVHGMPASGGVAEITDLPTAETDTSLVLAPDGAGGVEFRAETGGSGTAGTSILLDYALASDITNQAITATTAFDVIANQNFTVASASSIVEVAVRASGFFNDAVVNSYWADILIDSAGTPVTRAIGGCGNGSTVANVRANPFAGGPVFISGLSAATHTIKVRIYAVGNDHFFCRASTNAPNTGGEFLEIQVIEHKN
jgi:hypothetical protein